MERTRTAHDVAPVHHALAGFSEDELREIPVLETGTRLREDVTYLDLEQGPFVAHGVMFAAADQLLVPKDLVRDDTWNRLVISQ